MVTRDSKPIVNMLQTAQALHIADEDIQHKHVIVIGCGATGCAVLQLLARLGMKITVYDGDTISRSNLERQMLFYHEDVGKKKVDVAAARLGNLCTMQVHAEEVDRNTSLPKADLIIDCTDTMESRRCIDWQSKQQNVPWIYTAAAGAVATSLLVLPEQDARFLLEKEGQACCVIGVVNAAVTLAGSFAVHTALRYFSGSVEHRMLRFSCITGEMSYLCLPKVKN